MGSIRQEVVTSEIFGNFKSTKELNSASHRKRSKQLLFSLVIGVRDAELSMACFCQIYVTSAFDVRQVFSVIGCIERMSQQSPGKFRCTSFFTYYILLSFIFFDLLTIVTVRLRLSFTRFPIMLWLVRNLTVVYLHLPHSENFLFSMLSSFAPHSVYIMISNYEILFSEESQF